MTAIEAEAEILKNYGPMSVEDRIDFADQLLEQANQLLASAWSQCPEIQAAMPPDPQLN